ncbi:radical SAM protein, partial [bacterium]|nr:radical SAM protein [bacterium]
DALFEGFGQMVPQQFKYQKVWRVGLPYDEVVKRIPSDVDFIGIGAPFSNHANIIRELSKEIKNIYPKIPIVIGGTYASTSPEDILTTDVDYAICGEGEVPLAQLLSGRSPDKIKGLAYKRNSEVITSGRAEVIEDLDEIPFPARDVFHYNRVLDSIGPARIRVGTDIIESESRGIPIITSRGCPYDCTFCSVHFVHGYKWRFRSADNVIKEIIEVKEKYNVTDLSIIDDHLTAKHDRLVQILDRLIKLDLGIRWSTPNGVRLEHLDEEILTKMKKAGAVSVVLGIQSGDPKMLKIMRTKLDLRKAEKTVEICSRIGLEMAAFFIIGHPGEDRASFRKTIRYGQRLGKYGLKDFRINIARAYPKTKLFNYCKENDLFVRKDVENILIFPGEELEANIKTKDFDPKELIRRRNYTKRKLMAVENQFYWNIVYYAERLKLKEVIKKLLPERVWNNVKRIVYKILKR